MTSNNQFSSYLDSNQQDLLTAALNSNNPGNMGQQFGNDMSQFNFDGMDPSLFMNTNNLAMQDFNNFGAMNDSPFLDNYADNDANLDFDYNDADGQMIGSLPDDAEDDDDDDHLHDKRKSPDDDKEDNENGGKRREGEVKEPKKPGRKPLTSEPTNKRKAQNRAAQRAFRERKEKHLKDLETKVTELEKASEAANHENGLLRAQVDRLQIELREYRKRLSQNSGLLSRTPPLGGNMFLPNAASSNNSNNFQFEFPKFGSLPGGVFGNNNVAKKASLNDNNNANGVNGINAKNGVNGVLNRNGSNGRSLSPRSQARAGGSISSEASPQANGSMSSNAGTPERSNNSVSSVFTPASFNGQSGDGSLAFDSWFTTTTSAEPESISNGQQANPRIFQFNSSNNSTASPGSTSSASQYGGGPNSSCGTSPEPSHNSPKTGNLDTIAEGCSTVQTSDGEITFCDKLNMACGNIRNPIPRTKSQTSDGIKSTGANAQTTDTQDKTTALPQKDSDFNYFAALANQNGGGFDPQLFDTYREPQNAIVGDGDFTGGFFNDALPAGDFGTPFDWANITAPTGLTPFVSKQNPLEVADAIQNGEEDEVVPADDHGSMLTCHKIWDKLQDRPDFKDGSLDIDGLCSELRAKARCSESGVVIDQKDVDSALKRLSPPAVARSIAPAPATN